MMIETIALWIGYGIIIAGGLALLGFLLWLAYLLLDASLKKLLGWKHLETRRDIMYFVRHKKEIQDYIKKLNTRKQSKVH